MQTFYFRRGSIVVDLELVFKETSKDPLAPLKRSTEDGTLGSLRVYPESLKIKSAKTGKNIIFICFHLSTGCQVGGIVMF